MSVTTTLTSMSNLYSGGYWSVSVRSVVGCLFGIIIVVGALGNSIIIASIVRERRLHTRGHFLIGSLATADLLVSVLVSPFFAIMTLYKFSPSTTGMLWPPHPAICNLFVSLDVTCCTASIFHLCAIALDRYRAVTKLRYLSMRKFKEVLPSICGIWLFASLLSIAPYVIFSSTSNDVSNLKDDIYSVVVNSTLSSFVYSTAGNDMLGDDDDSLSCIMVNDNKIYRVIATTIAFYVPLVIIIAIYWRVSVIAWGRIHRIITTAPSNTSIASSLEPENYSKLDKTGALSSVSADNKPSENKRNTRLTFLSVFTRKFQKPSFVRSAKIKQVLTNHDCDISERNRPSETANNVNSSQNSIAFENNNVANRKVVLFHANKKLRINSCDSPPTTKQYLDIRRSFSASDVNEIVFNESRPQACGCCKTEVALTSDEADGSSTIVADKSVTYFKRRKNEIPFRKCIFANKVQCYKAKRQRKQACAIIPSIMITADDEANASRYFYAPTIVKQNKRTNSLQRSPSDYTSNTSSRQISFSVRNNKMSLSTSSLKFAFSEKFQGSTRSRSASVSLTRSKLTMNREKKVIRTMGAVIGAFIICWLPFFIKEIITPFCKESCHLNPSAEVFINWLGYTNSALNPFIYALHNEEFNKAISKLFRDFTCWCSNGFESLRCWC